MEKVINLGIPHVGELIFEGVDTSELIQYLLVSETWKILAENVLFKRWKGRIFEACEHGQTKIVELLLDRCGSKKENKDRSDRTIDLNARDEAGYTALMVACIAGHKGVVQLLLNYSESTIDLNERDESNGFSNGFTAFMMACTTGHKDVVQVLLDHSDQNLNAKDNFYGFTGFMWACYKGEKHVVQLLLDHSNIELDARDGEGRTAFLIACELGETDIVQSLICRSEQGAGLNVNAIENFGMNAFMLACLNGHKDVVELLFYRLGKNLRLNDRDFVGRTAFRFACVEGYKDIVQFLLNCSDIELNGEDDLGFTGFMWACFKGHKDVVKLLLEHTKVVDITIAEGIGFTMPNEIKELLLTKNDLNIGRQECARLESEVPKIPQKSPSRKSTEEAGTVEDTVSPRNREIESNEMNLH